MDLSVNIANLMGRYGFEKAATLYRENGFDSVDYDLNCMAMDPNHPFNGENWVEEAEKVRAVADRVGIRINQTHAPSSYHHWTDEEHYKNNIYPNFVRSVQISGILGASVCVMHPLHYSEYHGHEEEIYERNMKFYRSLIPVARDSKIKVGVENMWRHDPARRYIVLDTCGTKEEFVRYIDTLDDPTMIACLDLGHVNLPIIDETVADVIYALGHDRLGALHVHDNDFKTDQHALPFLGKMNWRDITKALGEIDYTGDFTYEVSNSFHANVDDDFMPQAIRYMADVGRFLMGRIDDARPAK